MDDAQILRKYCSFVRFSRDPLCGSAWSMCKNWSSLQLLAALAWKTTLEQLSERCCSGSFFRELVQRNLQRPLAQRSCTERAQKACIDNLPEKLTSRTWVEKLEQRKLSRELAQTNSHRETRTEKLAQRTCTERLEQRNLSRELAREMCKESLLTKIARRT